MGATVEYGKEGFFGPRKVPVRAVRNGKDVLVAPVALPGGKCEECERRWIDDDHFLRSCHYIDDGVARHVGALSPYPIKNFNGKIWIALCLDKPGISMILLSRWASEVGGGLGYE